VEKNDLSLTEWLSAFLEAELAEWDFNEQYPEDDYDDYGEDIDSDILESLVILALSGALAFLLYYRTQRQRRQEEERRRQEEQQRQLGVQGQGQRPGQQQQQQPDRGVFPNPNDPEFLNWVAGGVGH
jgi:SEL1 protein